MIPEFKVGFGSICTILFALCGACQEGRQEGFFAQMPRAYQTDSLSVYKDLFGSLTTLAYRTSDGSTLAVNCDDCTLIPFCGVLLFRNDTVFYSGSEGDRPKPFLVMNAPRFSGGRIEYSNLRIDSVTYMGKMYDKHYNDSIPFFRLNPKKRMAALDASYLKYIALKEGGIRYLTFSGMAGDISIRLSERPHVVLRTGL